MAGPCDWTGEATHPGAVIKARVASSLVYHDMLQSCQQAVQKLRGVLLSSTGQNLHAHKVEQPQLCQHCIGHALQRNESRMGWKARQLKDNATKAAWRPTCSPAVMLRQNSRTLCRSGRALTSFSELCQTRPYRRSSSQSGQNAQSWAGQPRLLCTLLRRYSPIGPTAKRHCSAAFAKQL
jgi:hypothetical protein